MKISTREANENDINSIFEIEKATFKNPWSKPSLYYEIVEDELSKVFVVEKDGQLVAYIGFMIIFDEIHIANVAVDKNFRGEGFGDILMKKITEFADENNLKVTLEVNVHNEVAISLYKKYGFINFGRRKNYYGIDEDAFIMWRE